MPHVTEKVQWDNHLVFYLDRKIFAILALEVPTPHCLSFKSTPAEAAELTLQPGVVPAPYLARAHWVALESWDALPRAEIFICLQNAHSLVYAKLPAKLRRQWENAAQT